jgi:hypothetical protein
MTKPLSHWDHLLGATLGLRRNYVKVVERFEGVQFETPPTKWKKQGTRWVKNPGWVLLRRGYLTRLRAWRWATKRIKELDKQIAFYDERIARITTWSQLLAGMKQIEREERSLRATPRNRGTVVELVPDGRAAHHMEHVMSQLVEEDEGDTPGLSRGDPDGAGGRMVGPDAGGDDPLRQLANESNLHG